MKKVNLFIFLIMNLLGFAQEVIPDLASYNLKGKVKNITTLTYEPIEKYGKIDKGDIIYSPAFSEDYNNKREFNENGYLVRYVLFNLDGSVADRGVYDYDDKNHLILNKTYKGDGTASIKRTYSYSLQGELNQSTLELFANGFKSKTFYSYDSEGNLKEIKIKNPDKSSDYIKTYKYEDGNLIEEAIKTGRGEFYALERYSYVGNNLIEQIKVDEFGNTQELLSFKYNEGNEVIEMIKYNSNGTLIHKEKKDYNRQGDVTSLVLESVTVKYVYEYDKHGNWVTKLRYKDGFPTHYFVREIGYY